MTSFFLSISQTPTHVLIIYTFAGLGAASFAPAMASFVGDITSKEKMGRAFGWYTSAMQVGMASGPVLGGLTAEYAGDAYVFILSGVVITIALLLAVLALPALSNEGLESGSVEHIGRSLKDLKGNRTVVACWLATICIAFGFGVFHPFFPLYAQSIGLERFSIGLLFGVNSFFNAVARIPAGYLSDRLGKRNPFIIIGMVIFAFSIVSLALSTNWYALIALVAFMGLTMGITTMALNTSLVESVLPAKRGIAMGGFSTALYGGFAISSALAGGIISSFGYFPGFLVAGIICAIGSLLFYKLIKNI
jgi:MFS family permease